MVKELKGKYIYHCGGIMLSDAEAFRCGIFSPASDLTNDNKMKKCNLA